LGRPDEEARSVLTAFDSVSAYAQYDSEDFQGFLRTLNIDLHELNRPISTGDVESMEATFWKWLNIGTGVWVCRTNLVEDFSMW